MPERAVVRGPRRALLAAALLAAVLPVGGPPAQAAPAWLTHLNGYRAQVGLPGLQLDGRLAGGIRNHSRYIVKTDDYEHSEDRSSPYYTPAGNAAGNRSNIAVRSGGAGDEIDDIDQWLRAPFHALAMLDPRLRATAYANYYDPGSPGYTYAAGIDVLTHQQGRDSASYPLTFPGRHAVLPVSLTTAADEVPDPLAPCGYRLPAGLPIIVSFGPAVQPPVVTSYSLTRDGVPVEACATSADSYADRSARALLHERNAVLLIPRSPLVPGSAYTAQVDVPGITETVSFSVARAPAEVQIEDGRSGVDCGDPHEIVGRLVPGHGGASRQPLQLWGRPSGSGRPWQLLRTATTSVDGRASFADLRPLATTDYQVRYGGNASNLPARSAIRTVTVAPRPWEVRPDQTELLYPRADSGTISGESGVGGGARLVLEEEQLDGSWLAWDAVATADADGRFRLTVPLGRPGRYTFRVAALAADCHEPGYSGKVTVTVLVASTP